MAKKASGLTKPVALKEAGQDLMKKKSAARGDITKKLWKYMKKEELQDPDDGRIIWLDEQLKYWLGTKKEEVTMFEMTKLWNKSLVAD